MPGGVGGGAGNDPAYPIERLGAAYDVGVDACLEMPASLGDAQSAARYYARLLGSRPELFCCDVDPDAEA
ncbi:MAG: hypothetical protein QM473_17040 [Acidobacteriota bacterium]|nr:hypothetical protein [Acidobacteriota bacterium]